MMAFVKILAQPCNLYDFFCGSQIKCFWFYILVSVGTLISVFGWQALPHLDIRRLRSFRRKQGGALGPWSPLEPSVGAVHLVTQSCLTLVTPCTAAHQAPLSRGFSRQEYWSGLPCPPPGELPNPGIEPVSLTSNLHWQVGSLPLALLGKPLLCPNPSTLIRGVSIYFAFGKHQPATKSWGSPPPFCPR